MHLNVTPHAQVDNAMQSDITYAITGPYKPTGVHAQVHALAHFPSLERERERTVSAVDALGGRYRLRFRYWVNNQSRMYVLEGCQPPDVRACAAYTYPTLPYLRLGQQPVAHVRVLEGCQPSDVRACAVPLSRGLCPGRSLTTLSKGFTCMSCVTASRRAYKLLPLFRLFATCALLCASAASSLAP